MARGAHKLSHNRKEQKSSAHYGVTTGLISVGWPPRERMAEQGKETIMRFGKHIAVVGAGVVGLAIAVRLRREGYRVTLIDPAEPGSQTSSGNAGLIMTAQISPLSSPGLWRKVPGMLLEKEGP